MRDSSHTWKNAAVNALTEQIIRAVIEVHQVLGSGFVESIYRNALILELRQRGLEVECEKEIDVFFKGEMVGRQQLDLLVAGSVILELKAVEALHGSHYAQLRSYLRATGLSTGLLINFTGPKADYRRIDLHTEGDFSACFSGDVEMKRGRIGMF